MCPSSCRLWLLGFVILLCWAAVLVQCQSDAEVKYFVDLIDRNLKATRNYKSALDASEFKPDSNKTKKYGNFDYIVVGAGSAGAVIAARLSEKSRNKVLLIEAGQNETDFTDVPSISFFLVATNFTWDFKTTPQNTACLGMKERQCRYPRGKGLGGSSIINSLNYVRGSKHDYDNWARMGIRGWSYKDVLPLFKKSEGAHFPVDPYYHNTTGPFTVELLRPNGRQYDAYLEANYEVGRRYLDYNAEDMLGVSQTQFTTRHGRRLSTNKAFLRPAEGRKNLEILTGAYATKINFNKKKEAQGITFTHNRVLYTANAKKEVIISAGTFQSAQLLMLSGIGRIDDLSPHGISSIQPLADVGRNLVDHNGYLGLIFDSNVTTLPKSHDEYVREYLRGYGPLTFAVNSKAISWYQTELEPVQDYPDIEVIMVTSNNSGEITQRFNNYADDTYKALYTRVNPIKSFSTSLLLMRPKSRGRVYLKSDSPFDYPLIDSNMYTDPENYDIEAMYQGIQIILNLINNTEAFRSINATLIAGPHPNCVDEVYLSREFWYCQLKQLTLPFYHPAGTCRMGPNMLAGDVVNNRLQVHGVSKLRVADCSIMPTQITGHTNAPAVMIGEMAAELILSGK